jgi:hypothetical protein
MEEPERVPDWLTTGKTYLLPKSGKSKKSETTDPLTFQSLAVSLHTTRITFQKFYMVLVLH